MWPLPLVQCGFGLGCTSLSQLWAFEITLGAASFPRGSFYKKKKNIYIYINSLKFLCSFPLWTCRDPWRLQPWKPCNSVPTAISLLDQSVAGVLQFHLLKAYIIHLIFLLARGRGCGEHFFMECQSGDDHNSCTSLWWKMLYLAFQTSVSHKQLTEASVWASCTWNFHPHPQAL